MKKNNVFYEFLKENTILKFTPNGENLDIYLEDKDQRWYFSILKYQQEDLEKTLEKFRERYLIAKKNNPYANNNNKK